MFALLTKAVMVIYRNNGGANESSNTKTLHKRKP